MEKNIPSGMGRGIAMVLAEEGYDIAFSYYPKAENAEASVETTMSMLKQRGAQGWYFQAGKKREKET